MKPSKTSEVDAILAAADKEEVDRALAEAEKEPATPSRTFKNTGPIGDIEAELKRAHDNQAPQTNQAAAAFRHFAQGYPIVGPWTDEAAAGLEHGISKIPGVRDWIAKGLNRPSIADPNLTFDQRHKPYDEINERSEKDWPGTTLLTKAGSGMIPAGPSFASMPARVAWSALRGLNEGAGYSRAHLGSEDSLLDMAKGAGIGTIAGALSEVPHAFHGAPDRVDDRMLNQMGEGAGRTNKNRLLAAEPKILEVAKEPGIKTALENADHPETVAVTEKHLADGKEAAGKLLAKADSKAGGMPVGQFVNALQAHRDALAAGPSNHPPALKALDNVIQNFRSGVGRAGDEARVPASDVRTFVTEHLQHPGHKGDPNGDPYNVIKNALKSGGDVGRNEMLKYVHTEASPADAKELAKVWDRMSALKVIRDAAEVRANASRFAPSAASSLFNTVGSNKAETAAAAVGGKFLGVPGAIGGVAAVKGAKAIGAKATDVMARPGVQNFVNDIPEPIRKLEPAHSISQVLIDKFSHKDHEGAQKALADHIWAPR